MGIALMMEGVLSACYHVCPNYSNFQFGKPSCRLLCLKKDLPSLSSAELQVFLTFLLLQSFQAWSEDSESLDEKRKRHSKTGEFFLFIFFFNWKGGQRLEWIAWSLRFPVETY